MFYTPILSLEAETRRIGVRSKEGEKIILAYSLSVESLFYLTVQERKRRSREKSCIGVLRSNGEMSQAHRL